MLEQPRKIATATSTVSLLMVGIVTAASLSMFTPTASASDLTQVRGTTDQERKGFMIAAQSDRSDRGFSDSKVKLTMVLRNASGAETSRKMAFYTLEVPDESTGDKSMIVFSSPPDIKGTALLSHAKILKPDNQWLFLPALKRIKRISSANKSGPFVGSEFAFEDFTALELNKFDYTWNKKEACGDYQCNVVTRVPRYENSGYSKQIIWIDTTDLQIRKVEFYDRRGDLLKTLSLENYLKYNDVWRPHLLSMVNHQTGKSTDLVYDTYTFKTGLKSNDFIKTRLKRMR